MRLSNLRLPFRQAAQTEMTDAGDFYLPRFGRVCRTIAFDMGSLGSVRYEAAEETNGHSWCVRKLSTLKNRVDTTRPIDADILRIRTVNENIPFEKALEILSEFETANRRQGMAFDDAEADLLAAAHYRYFAEREGRFVFDVHGAPHRLVNGRPLNGDFAVTDLDRAAARAGSAKPEKFDWDGFVKGLTDGKGVDPAALAHFGKLRQEEADLARKIKILDDLDKTLNEFRSILRDFKDIQQILEIEFGNKEIFEHKKSSWTEVRKPFRDEKISEQITPQKTIGNAVSSVIIDNKRRNSIRLRFPSFDHYSENGLTHYKDIALGRSFEALTRMTVYGFQLNLVYKLNSRWRHGPNTTSKLNLLSNLLQEEIRQEASTTGLNREQADHYILAALQDEPPPVPDVFQKHGNHFKELLERKNSETQVERQRLERPPSSSATLTF